MYFQERQTLLNNYTKIIFVIPVIVIFFFMFSQKNSLSVWVISTVVLLLVILIGLVISKSRLTISEEKNGLKLQVSFLFGQKVFLNWEEIESVTLKKINPVFNFGGWGIRYTINTTGYIFRGNDGVFMKTKKGRVYVFTIVNKDDFSKMLKEKNLLVLPGN